jgi:hypothetical protein
MLFFIDFTLDLSSAAPGDQVQRNHGLVILEWQTDRLPGNCSKSLVMQRSHAGPSP